MKVLKIAQWGDDAAIDMADRTDPWLLEPDGKLVLVSEVVRKLPQGLCGECRGGFFAPTNNGPTDQGVERCDACKKYPGDLHAALALAKMIGPDITVWYQEEE